MLLDPSVGGPLEEFGFLAVFAFFIAGIYIVIKGVNIVTNELIKKAQTPKTIPVKIKVIEDEDNEQSDQLDFLSTGDQGDSIDSDPTENAGVDSIENKKDIV